MEKSREFLLFLSLFDFTHTKFQQIVDFMGDDLSITKFCKKKFPNEILTKEQYEKMVEKADAILINNYDENLKDKDIFQYYYYYFPRRLIDGFQFAMNLQIQ